MTSARLAPALRPAGAAPDPLGWPFAPQPQEGGLAHPALEKSVRDQIRIILETAPGEMLLHPDFGAGLADLLHEPNTLTTRKRVHDRIARALALWEPRIAVEGIEVWELEDRPDTLRVELTYRLLRTGSGSRMLFDLAMGG
ncbi:GPW/gp25 family protein [Mangrovicoccus sp. HB161399]|uniref:GPW/gp25 family protein n=1 Tax=Mangrovicoccus sp. HB161399 TaxID=2720392 RepID=UPI001556C477|nr:GPW/gp25 family protein [Mangrovicoccus sp. HB161399]